MISVTVRNQPPAGSNVQLDVEESGNKIVVRSGKFTLLKKDYDFDQDWTFTLTPRAEVQTVSGYLVEDLLTGTIELFVDEFLASEAALSDWSLTNKKPLHALFMGVVPANDTDFSNTKVEILKSVPSKPSDSGE